MIYDIGLYIGSLHSAMYLPLFGWKETSLKHSNMGQDRLKKSTLTGKSSMTDTALKPEISKHMGMLPD